jgi:hypothetical protein
VNTRSSFNILNCIMDTPTSSTLCTWPLEVVFPRLKRNCNDDIYVDMNAFGRAAGSSTPSTINAERDAILDLVPFSTSRQNLEHAWASRCSVANIITLAPSFQLTSAHIPLIYLISLSSPFVCFAVVFLGTLNSSLKICEYTDPGQFSGGQAGIVRCILSILLVSMTPFLPLFLQGMTFYSLNVPFVNCY